jgi:hypothetical protein
VLVEIEGKEAAGLVLQHRIHAGHERLTRVIVPQQVPPDSRPKRLAKGFRIVRE